MIGYDRPVHHHKVNIKNNAQYQAPIQYLTQILLLPQVLFSVSELVPQPLINYHLYFIEGLCAQQSWYGLAGENPVMVKSESHVAYTQLQQ